MSQQTYPVKCECGKVHQCPAGYAGTRFACPCGKTVEVPTLSVLRTTVIEGETSPETEVAARGRLGQLPLEEECVNCGRETDRVESVVLECERPTSGFPVAAIVLGFVLFACLGWMGVLLWYVFGRIRLRDVTGEYVAYELPVRVCGECGGELTTSAASMRAVLFTPLYARLVAKHPNAFVITCSGAPGVVFANPYRTRRRRRRLMWLAGIASGVLVFAMSLWAAVDHLVPVLPGVDRATRPLAKVAVGVIALGGGVLAGWGVSLVVGRLHRHLFPDEPPAAEHDHPSSGDSGQSER